MAGCREVDAEVVDEPRSFARRPGDSCRLYEGRANMQLNNYFVATIGGSGRRDGLGPRASMPDLAGLVPATRGLIAAPWTPASLSLLPARKTVDTSHVTS
jgi:hypothetical protein